MTKQQRPRQKRWLPLIALAAAAAATTAVGSFFAASVRAQMPAPKPRPPVISASSRAGELAAFARFFQDKGFSVAELHQEFHRNGQVKHFRFRAAKQTEQETGDVEATIADGRVTVTTRSRLSGAAAKK